MDIKQSVLSKLSEVGTPVDICLSVEKGENGEIEQRFRNFAHDLCETLTFFNLNIVSQVNDESGNTFPYLSIFGHDHREIARYYALPEGPEGEPFFEFILKLAKQNNDEKSTALDGLNSETEITVFIAPTCPHCPAAVKIALDLALESDKVKATIIDSLAFPSLGEKYSLQSVPLTVLPSGFSKIGVIPKAELIGHLRAIGTDDHEKDLFRSLVESGRHEEAAAKVCTAIGAQTFLEWWKKSVLNERIALVLVCEEALERDTRSLDSMVDTLINVTQDEDASLRGDTADLLGRIGHPKALSALKRLCKDENADVREIAEEALEELDELDENSSEFDQ